MRLPENVPMKRLCEFCGLLSVSVSVSVSGCLPQAAAERLASGAPGGSTPTPGGKQAQERDGAKQMFPKASVKPQGQ